MRTGHHTAGAAITATQFNPITDIKWNGPDIQQEFLKSTASLRLNSGEAD
jgi:hypothetical protein